MIGTFMTVIIICVLPGAKVHTSDGTKKIEDIRKGDLVIDEFGNTITVINNIESQSGLKGYTLF